MLPTLETERLQLRAFTEADAAEVGPLIGAREVAATTLRIPHPYADEDFRYFLKHMQGEAEPNFAITLCSSGRVIGGIGLRMRKTISGPNWVTGWVCLTGDKVTLPKRAAKCCVTDSRR